MWKDGSEPKPGSSDTPRAVHIIVHGLVQGIGFRAWTVSRARDLAIKGWVKNRNDSSVEIFAEGSTDNVNAFIDMLKTGHPWARIERIDITFVSLQNPPGFTIVK